MPTPLSPEEGFLKTVLSLPGNKILTIVSDAEDSPFLVDVAADATIGYDPTHSALLRREIRNAFSKGAGIILRQFTELKVPSKTKRGRIDLPVKHLYGCAIVNGKVVGMSALEVADASQTDYATGSRIPGDDTVKYHDWPGGVGVV